MKMSMGLKEEQINISILKLDGFKQPKFKGIDYPLHAIHPRDFEKLLYFLYKNQIDNGNLGFDDITLLSGCKDKGQDCLLYKTDERAGLIQCKHSSTNSPLNKRTALNEIIKFILYSELYSELIPDINTYSYYLASSSGFDNIAAPFLKTYKTAIKKEKDLEKQIRQVIAKNPQIKKANLDNIAIDNTIKKLKSIKIILIDTIEIQEKLSNNKSIAKHFFELDSFIDIGSLAPIIQDWEVIKKQVLKEEISVAEIIKEFKNASVFLKNVKSNLTLKKPYHIIRKETNSIFDWIQSDLEINDKNIYVLIGNAGYGKSVILKELYEKLENEGIIVIGLKADDSSGSNIKALEIELNLTCSILKSITQITESGEKVVVLIDQIDALSQSLSNKQDCLNTYIYLILSLLNIDNVRVIVSIRDYDLQYDPKFDFLNRFGSQRVELIDTTEVIKVLRILKIDNYSDRLIELLRTPLHLEIFCDVYKENENNLSYNSLYDLYCSFWLKKVKKGNNIFKSVDLERTLFDISRRIQLQGTNLNVKKNLFYLGHIEFLCNEGLLIPHSNNVKFFHQSFYDFVYAKSFVESDSDIVNYIFDNLQSIEIRTSVKLILSFLRDDNPQKYIEIISQILSNTEIRYHIKLLIINFLGFNEPNKLEINFVENSIIKKELEREFIESIKVSGWLHIIFKSGVAIRLLKNNEDGLVLLNTLRRNIYNSSVEIHEFLNTLEVSESNNLFISNILYYSTKWDAKAIQLFERVKHLFLDNPHQYCHYLENSLQFDEKWTVNTFLYIQEQRIGNTSVNNFVFNLDYSEVELIKKIRNRKFELVLKIIYKLLELYAKKNDKEYSEFSILINFDLEHFDRERQYSKDKFLDICIDFIEEISIVYPKHFKEFYNKHKNSSSQTYLNILLYGFQKNVLAYKELIFEYLIYLHSITGFALKGFLQKFDYQIRTLLSFSYPNFDQSQKKALNNIILSIKSKYESGVFNYNGVKEIVKRNGESQFYYLIAIPQIERNKFSSLKLKFQELERKFGNNINLKEPGIVGVRKVPPPYSKLSYERMKFEDWIKTFKKFNEDEEFRFNGGKLEHSRAFEDEVLNRPEFFFDFICDLVKK
jgi:hypothetical protein